MSKDLGGGTTTTDRQTAGAAVPPPSTRPPGRGSAAGRIDPEPIAEAIRALARTALAAGPQTQAARDHAHSAQYRPISYMRCAEFYAAVRHLDLRPGMRLLDISSPQWLVPYLARENPEVQFVYTNILDSEIAPFQEIARLCGLTNVEYRKEDVRKLNAGDASFDRVLSISVIEHIAPEVGGDLQAMAEIKRVLKPDGQLVISVPFKEKWNVVYQDAAVYERGFAERNFFAREYDQAGFDRMVAAAGFAVGAADYVTEKRGLLGLDYYEYGPGRGTRMGKASRIADKLVKRVQSRLGRPIQHWAARRHLRVSPRIDYRLVNIVATLTPERERSDPRNSQVDTNLRPSP